MSGECRAVTVLVFDCMAYNVIATVDDRSGPTSHVHDKLNQTVASLVTALSTLVNILVDSTAMKALAIL